MRKKRIFQKIAAVLLALTLLLSLCSISVCAAPDGGDDGSGSYTDDGSGSGADPGDNGSGDGDDGSGDNDSGDNGSGDSGDPGDGGDPSGDGGDDSGDTPTDPPEDVDGIDPTEDEDYSQSTYTEPEHLDELPTTVEGEVQPATAVAVPTAKVSNASLFSGIIMWLCVAVGIAVVVGVMVSKRTRRRGS